MSEELEELRSQVAALTALVERSLGGPAETDAGLNGSRSSEGPPSAERADLEATSFAPLVSTDPKSALGKERMGWAAANLPPAVRATFVRYGARGLYRRSRHTTFELPLAARRYLVADAQAESPREAKGMGADMLKSWGVAAPPT